MKNKKNNLSILLIFLIALIFQTAFSDKSAATESSMQPNRYTIKELKGFKLTLLSITSIGIFKFKNTGHVIATIGRVGGPLAGPVYEWSIDEEGRIVIDHGNSKEIWTIMSVNGDLIEIERATVSIEPYHNRYRISRSDDGIADDDDYPETSFTSEELAGCILQFAEGPDSKYAFYPDGKGAFIPDPKSRFMKREGEQAFQWSVDLNGKLHMNDKSGSIKFWRKISRKDDIIEAEITLPLPPPRRDTFRRSKQ